MSAPELTLEHFTETDRAAMRRILDKLIANDREVEEKVELRQGGFTLWVKTEGKPGVAAMQRLLDSYVESPSQLCLILRKLFADNRGTDHEG